MLFRSEVARCLVTWKVWVAGIAAAALILMANLMPAVAVLPSERLDNPVLEARARALSQELRCLVCQNQTIAESSAPLAVDLREQVREQVRQGRSDREIVDFLVARYGDFVLLNPPFNWRTALLWFAPGSVLFAGALGLLLFLRRRGQGGGETVPESAVPLSAAEQAKGTEILSSQKK